MGILATWVIYHFIVEWLWRNCRDINLPFHFHCLKGTNFFFHLDYFSLRDIFPWFIYRTGSILSISRLLSQLLFLHGQHSFLSSVIIFLGLFSSSFKPNQLSFKLIREGYVVTLALENGLAVHNISSF